MDGRVYGEKKKQDVAGVVLASAKQVIELARKQTIGGKAPTREIGVYRGYMISVAGHFGSIAFELKGAESHNPENLIYDEKDEFSVNGFFTRIDNFLDKLDTKRPKIEAEREREKADF